MGTDISMHVEVRKQGRWHLAEPLEQTDLTLYGIDREIGFKPKEIYTTRCSALFAVLADVNNPVRDLTPFDCIAKPRGIPPDISDELGEWYSHFKGNVFSESWLLLKELLAFDWHGKRIQRRGMGEKDAVHLFQNGRFPPASKWPKGQIHLANQGLGSEVTWGETYAEAVDREFMELTLKKLSSFGLPDEVRIVFWFDN